MRYVNLKIMPARKQRLVALVVLMFAQAGSALITSGGLGALAPFFASTLDLNRTQIGILSGVVGVTWIFAASPAGVLADRFNERIVIAASGLAMAAALFAACAMQRFEWLLLWLGIFGAGAAFSNPAGARAVMTWFTRSRGMAMSIRQAGVPVGGFVAALILPPIAAHYDYRASLWVAGCLIILTSAAVLVVRGPAFPSTVQKRHVAHLWKEMRSFARDRRSILLSITQMDQNAAQTCCSSFLAISLLTTAHLTVVDAVLALAAMQMGAILGRFFWGILSDRALGGERLIPVAIASVIGAAAELSFAFHFPSATPAIRFGAFVCAFLAGSTISGCNGLFAIANAEVAGPGLAGSAIGIATSRTSYAMALAPPVFGFIADHLGFSAAWEILAAFTLCGVAPALYARRIIKTYEAA